MGTAAFSSLPCLFLPQAGASRWTLQRTHTSVRRPSQVYCLVPSQVPSARTTAVSAVEDRFRQLGADAAADLAYVSLSSASASVEHPSISWPLVLDVFATHAVEGTVLSHIARRLGVPELLCLDSAEVGSVLQYLSSYLNLSDVERNRVITQRPDIFMSAKQVQDAVEALELAGLQLKDIQRVVQRWPGLLLLDADRIRRNADFLQSSRVGFSKTHLRSLLRRASWILVYDIDVDMMPAILCLREVSGVTETAPVDHYIRASPLLLGTSPSAMRKVAQFLVSVIGLESDMLQAALRSFPPLLTCSVDVNLEPAAHFLSNDLSLEPEELAKVVRAFPAVLTLDVECDMREVVNYFRQRGVINVGRIVKRLPPILGFDLETNIIPKMEYIEQELGLSSYDVLRFPGYFSYSMEKCIEPRTKFLQAKGRSVTQSGLNMALALTDEDFCERIANASLSQYFAFRKAYHRKKDKGQRVALSAEDQKSLQYEEVHEGALEGKERTNVVPRSSSGTNTSARRRKRRFRATLSRLPWNELK